MGFPSNTTRLSCQDLPVHLGIVTAMSPVFGNEGIVIALVPKIPYPTASAASRDMDMDTASP